MTYANPQLLLKPSTARRPIGRSYSMKALRPVGDYIPFGMWKSGTALPDWTCNGRYAVRFFGSGTAALSAALKFSAQRRPAGRFALLPGYGCPDLVAAASFAHLAPRLVDLKPDSPWLDPIVVERDLRNATALVAVNFLGMRECLEPLVALGKSMGVPVIEDSAQMAPLSGNVEPSGDIVVISFGRGKPLALLGGGALLIRVDWSAEFDCMFAMPPPDRIAAGYWLKCLLYNAAIHPAAYWWLRKIPILRLGEVAYHQFEGSRPISAAALARLADVIVRASKISNAQAMLARCIPTLDCAPLDLATANGATALPLLRYPVLLRDETQRDACFARLDAAGLGASRMYVRALCDIPGVPGVTGQPVPNARSFAARLLTLPIHTDVTSADVSAMISTIAST